MQHRALITMINKSLISHSIGGTWKFCRNCFSYSISLLGQFMYVDLWHASLTCHKSTQIFRPSHWEGRKTKYFFDTVKYPHWPHLEFLHDVVFMECSVWQKSEQLILCCKHQIIKNQVFPILSNNVNEHLTLRMCVSSYLSLLI